MELAVFILGIFCAFLLVIFLQLLIEHVHIRREAIIRGYVRYNPKTTDWEWINKE